MSLQELTAAGFTPINAILIVALFALGKVVLALHQKSEQSREEWHTETRQRVDAMQGHIETCEKDREDLREKLGSLETTVDRMNRCPKTDCPLRLT